MDDESAQVVLSLQLHDLNRLLGTSVQAEDGINEFDGRVALIAYRDEIVARLGFLQDRRMGRSIARAVSEDESALRQVQSQENDAIRDRNVACEIGGLRNEPRPAQLDDLISAIDDLVITNYAQLNRAISEETALIPTDASPQGTPAQHTQPSHEISSIPAGQLSEDAQPLSFKEVDLGVQKICTSCSESIHYFKAVYAPCGHDYCQDCTKRLFQNSMRDEALFPPRCCRQAIPLAAVDIFLTAEVIERFEEKAVEFSTPDRLYCAWPTCSAFIPPAKIKGDIVICPKCDFWICTRCKGKSHSGRDCPKDASFDALVSTALKAGWQRCNRCKRYIELMHGCNHITCPCSAEFCYLCAKPWKTCPCPQWDENRLISRANVVAQRQPVPPAHAQRQVVVENIRRHIRSHHECDLHDWEFHPGRHRCEGCEESLSRFIYICRDCNLASCSNCRRQRF